MPRAPAAGGTGAGAGRCWPPAPARCSPPRPACRSRRRSASSCPASTMPGPPRLVRSPARVEREVDLAQRPVVDAAGRGDVLDRPIQVQRRPRSRRRARSRTPPGGCPRCRCARAAARDRRAGCAARTRRSARRRRSARAASPQRSAREPRHAGHDRRGRPGIEQRRLTEQCLALDRHAAVVDAAQRGCRSFAPRGAPRRPGRTSSTRSRARGGRQQAILGVHAAVVHEGARAPLHER